MQPYPSQSIPVARCHFQGNSPAAIESSCHQHPSFIQRRHCTAGAAHRHGGARGEGHAAGVQDPGENPWSVATHRVVLTYLNHQNHGFNMVVVWKIVLSPCHRGSHNYLCHFFQWKNVLYISVVFISSKASIDCWSAKGRKLNIINKTIGGTWVACVFRSFGHIRILHCT